MSEQVYECFCAGFGVVDCGGMFTSKQMTTAYCNYTIIFYHTTDMYLPVWCVPKETIASTTIDFFGVNGNIGEFGTCGAASRIRTADLLITNQLLYQLSYSGVIL